MKTYWGGGVKMQLHAFLTSELDGSSWMFRFTLWPLCPRRKCQRYLLHRRPLPDTIVVIYWADFVGPVS